ncbi:EamA family transporter RarD [bacterium]|nr:EamA family transporter RarD [bacterium]
MKNRGKLYAVSAYLMWGFFPIYWKAIQNIRAYEIICHRILWSFLLLLAALLYKNKIKDIRPELKVSHVFLYAGTALMLALNWTTYVWAVNSGYIVEASLGYFINPLISVFLGVLILKEKLRLTQWVAIGIAFVGVLYLTFIYGSFPWISIILAFTFGFYGLIHKLGPLGSMEGLFVETGILLLPVIVILGFFESNGTGAFGHVSGFQTMLLIFTGAATAIPLVLFTEGLRKIPLSTIGILQYIAPSLQFLVGVIIYNESFSLNRLTGFVFVWCALVIYTVDGIKTHRKNKS